ncbi:MAG: LuxR C-terminal-related transcriptional regulator [Vicinamibacterales bacterium]
MNVILIGTKSERDRLRATLGGTSLNVVAEAATQAEARQNSILADAWLLPVSHVRGQAPPHIYQADLTPRELDVLDLLALGLSNRAIAERLGISDQTVKFHVAALSGKLGASNRTSAVRLAMERGLVTL